MIEITVVYSDFQVSARLADELVQLLANLRGIAFKRLFAERDIEDVTISKNGWDYFGYPLPLFIDRYVVLVGQHCRDLASFEQKWNHLWAVAVDLLSQGNADLLLDPLRSFRVLRHENQKVIGIRNPFCDTSHE